MMKKLMRKLSNNPIYGLLSSLITNILYVLVLLNIQNYLSLSRKISVIIVASLTLIVLLVNLLFVLGYSCKKSWARKVMLTLSAFVTLVFGVSVYYTMRLNKSIDALIDQDDQEILDYSFVTLNQNITLDNLYAEDKIGYVLGKEEFNESVKEEISSVSPAIKVETFERYDDLLASLADEEGVELAILPKHFRSYAESLANEVQEELMSVNVIHEFNITLVGEGKSQARVLEEPFSILMMGINENLADSIILATVNPKTLGVTMTSIARDSFVPISCYPGQAYDQINHARGISRQCIINTVENMLDLEIDFFFETDFYALVKIVDVLGGLELESPISFGGSLPKEENPNEFHEIYIKKGKYEMTGKEVITFARERHHFASGDFQRQLNQQYVIKELAQKIFADARKNPDTLIKVLQAAEKNIVMDLSMNRHISPILGHAINNIAASPVAPLDTFLIQSTQIMGEGTMINGSWFLIPYNSSIEEVKALIKQNMSLEIPEPTHLPFSFSINHPVEFGLDTSLEGFTGGLLTDPDDHVEVTYYDIPDFRYMSLDEIKSWGSNNGVEIFFTYIDESHSSFSSEYEDGQIIYQSTSAGEVTTLPSSIEVSVVDKPYVEPEPEPSGTFVVPKFDGMSLDEIKSWGSNNGVTLDILLIKEGHEAYKDHYRNGQVIYQSTEPGEYSQAQTYIEISYVVKSEDDQSDD